MLEEDDDVSSADICMIPPDDIENSDGDSDDEDMQTDVNHLSKGNCLL